MNQTCFPQDEIAAYVLGTVDNDKLDAVGDHLADCPRCQEIAKEMDSASDKLTDLLRGPKPADDFSSEPECQQVLPKVKKIGDTLFGSSETSREGTAGDELTLPLRLGEYLVLERIGGHMGDVYKALHTTMDRFVAVKVLPAKALADQQAIGRFQQEMKAVGRLEHPNIVRAYDAREIEGKHVLVMELVEGKNLSNVVDSSGRLSVADACEVVRQAAVGLQYVHEKGLVHRDVKPSNLMLTPEGQVRILDLGLARFRAHRPSAKEMTGVGQAVGTPNYMAPEQVSDSRQVDTRADVYGLGCTLYKLLSGRAPYDDPRYEHTLDILTAHLSEPVPSIKAVRPDIPDELAPVVDRMLAKSPSDRFATPGQVAAALEPFTAGSDLRALAARWEIRQQSEVRSTSPSAQSPFPWFWKLLGTAAVLMLLIVGGKMAAERLAPYWSDSNETSLARLPKQAPNKHRQSDQSTPVTNGQDASKQETATVAEPKKQPQPKQESPKTSSRSKLEQSGKEEPPITVTGPGPIKPPPTMAGDQSSPAQTGSDSIKPPPSTEPDVRQPAATPEDNHGWLTGAHNPKAAFEVSVEVDHVDRIYRGPPAGEDGKGEVMRVTVKSSKPGHLYLIYQASDGSLKCLYPNKVQRDNKIAAGREITVPHPDAKFRLRVGPPYGKELLKAVVTLTPRTPEDFGVESFTEGDVTPLKVAALKNVLVELDKDPANWAEHQVEITTMPPEKSDEPQRMQGVKPIDNNKSQNSSSQSSERRQSRRVGLFVGSDQYQDSRIRKLKTARNDALKMHEVMRAYCGLDEGIVLTDEQATRQAIREVICNTLVAATHPGDEVFIYWSGHGTRCPASHVARVGESERLPKNVPPGAAALAPGLCRMTKKDGTSWTTTDAFDDCLVPYDARLVDVDVVSKSVPSDNGSSGDVSSRKVSPVHVSAKDAAQEWLSRFPRVFPVDSTSVIRDSDLTDWLQKLDGRRVALIMDVGFCPRSAHFRADDFGMLVMVPGASENEKGLRPSRPPLELVIERCFLGGEVVRPDAGEELLSADAMGPNGIAVLMAAKVGNPVFERREGDLSVMTHFLTKLLAEGKEPITLAAVYKHLKTEVFTYVREKEKDVPDFLRQKPLLIDRNATPVYLRPQTPSDRPLGEGRVSIASSPLPPGEG